MAFSVGTGKGIRPSMNVTPLVDVVLVLLIIFMVITPLLAREFALQLPPKDENEEPPPPNPDAPTPIVLAVKPDGSIVLNRQVVAADQIAETVQRVLSSRAEKVVFFDAADDAPYGSAVAALDAARKGGAQVIAVLPDKLSE